MDENSTPLPDAQNQLRELLSLYDSYTAASRQLERELDSTTNLIRKWLTHDDAAANHPMHQEFLQHLTRLTEELAGSLARLPEEQHAQGQAVAVQAAERILQPVPEKNRTVDQWMCIAAQAACAPLLPLLDRDALQALRDGYVARTPRRLMFPKQKELYQEMERLLRS